MLNNPQLYIFLLLTACAFFWGTPPTYSKLRAGVLIFFSTIFLFSIAPYSIIGVIGITFYLVALSYMWNASVGSSFILYLSYITLIIAFSLVRLYSGTLGLLMTLGLTFSLLRAVVLIFQSHKKKQPLGVIDSLLYMLFFPTYSIGPIERIGTVSIKSLKTNAAFIPENFIYGIIRLILGIFKVTYVSGLISPWIEQMEKLVFLPNYNEGVVYILLYSLIKLLFVYINFSGFSDVAIGSGRMFGIKIMENFNSPFLATNIIDFWQRWHMSLGVWIRNHLYMPLIRNTGKIYRSIFIAFIAVGLWHDYTINYLVWGVGHGAALALTQRYKRSRKTKSIGNIFIVKLSNIITCILTIIYVAILSTFANCGSLEKGLIYLSNLI